MPEADHMKTWWGAPWTDVLTGIGTVALAVVTVLGVGVTLYLSHRQLKAATEEVREARGAADEAATEERERLAAEVRLAASRDTAATLARRIASAWPEITPQVEGSLSRLQDDVDPVVVVGSGRPGL